MIETTLLMHSSLYYGEYILSSKDLIWVVTFSITDSIFNCIFTIKDKLF